MVQVNREELGPSSRWKKVDADVFHCDKPEIQGGSVLELPHDKMRGGAVDEQEVSEAQLLAPSRSVEEHGRVKRITTLRVCQ
jgi:hypothetical protein